MACGKKPVSISLDNYFVDRELTPLDETGDYDFEHIEALNLPLFNDQMNRLLVGEEVELPRYDFPTGMSVPSGRRLRLQPDTILILEATTPSIRNSARKFPTRRNIRYMLRH